MTDIHQTCHSSTALLTTESEALSDIKIVVFLCLAIFNDIILLPCLFAFIFLGFFRMMMGNGYICACDEISSTCHCPYIKYDGYKYGSGKGLADTNLYVSGMTFCIFIAVAEFLPLVAVLLIFVFNFLKGSTFLIAITQGMKLGGKRFASMKFMFMLRFISFICGIALLFTFGAEPEYFDCHCEGSAQITWGSKYEAYTLFFNSVLVYAIFCGTFLLSRNVLIWLIRRMKSTHNHMLLEMHYIKIDHITI